MYVCKCLCMYVCVCIYVSKSLTLQVLGRFRMSVKAFLVISDDLIPYYLLIDVNKLIPFFFLIRPNTILSFNLLIEPSLGRFRMSVKAFLVISDDLIPYYLFIDVNKLIPFFSHTA
jgi:hypothetical protein